MRGQGPVRATSAKAEADLRRDTAGCEDHGGYSDRRVYGVDSDGYLCDRDDASRWVRDPRTGHGIRADREPVQTDRVVDPHPEAARRAHALHALLLEIETASDTDVQLRRLARDARMALHVRFDGHGAAPVSELVLDIEGWLPMWGVEVPRS